MDVDQNRIDRIPPRRGRRDPTSCRRGPNSDGIEQIRLHPIFLAELAGDRARGKERGSAACPHPRAAHRLQRSRPGYLLIEKKIGLVEFEGGAVLVGKDGGVAAVRRVNKLRDRRDHDALCSPESTVWLAEGPTPLRRGRAHRAADIAACFPSYVGSTPVSRCSDDSRPRGHRPRASPSGHWQA